MTSDANGVYRGVYTYGQERISVRDLVEVEGVPNDPLYYMYDGRGSVTQLTNAKGNVRDQYRYTPFGEPMSGGELSPNTKLLNNPYGYNGEYHDLESGFQYLRARYYNPETARFITRDSYLGDVNEPLTLNRYAYTSNNPVMKIDPSGHINLEAGGGGSRSRTYSTSTSSSTATKAATNNQPTLKKGSTDSNSVSKLQNMLRTIGYDIDVDGKFGEQTKKAVMDFQTKSKLGVDGVVGNQTWSSINTVYRNVESTGIPVGKITIPKGSSKSNSNSYIGSKMDLQLSYNKKDCGDEERIDPSLWDKVKVAGKSIVNTYETVNYIKDSVEKNPIEFGMGVSESILQNVSIGFYGDESYYFDDGKQTAYMAGKGISDAISTAGGAVATAAGAVATFGAGAGAVGTSGTGVGALAFGTVSIESAGFTAAAAGYTGNSAKNLVKDSKDLFSNASKAKDGGSKAVNNMSEFFDTEFGGGIKNSLTKTKKQYDGQAVYEVTSKVENEYLKKGDQIYLDNKHKDHLEVFDKRGKAKAVINLDGTLNVSKTETALKEGRTIGK